MMVSRETLDRIFAKRRIVENPEMGSPCWEFTGARTAGYGVVGTGAKSVGRVHRIMYEAVRGVVPDGLQLDHLCRNRACFKPDHLEPVTSRENTMRGENFTARNARKTHCPRGHGYTDENTYFAPGTGWRQCLTCRTARNRARYEKAAVTPQPWDVTEVRIAERS